MATISRNATPRLILLRNLSIQPCPTCGRLTDSILIFGHHAQCDRCGSRVTDNAGKNALVTRASEKQNPVLMVGPPVTDNCVCRACKRPFTAKRQDAQYCSSRCRQKAKRAEALTRQREEYQQRMSASY